MRVKGERRPDGPRNLRNERFREDPRPIVDGLDNYCCRHFSRAYLRHLHVAGEMLAGTLLTRHNLHFFLDLMTQARAHLEAGDFASWSAAWIKRYEAAEAERERGDAKASRLPLHILWRNASAFLFSVVAERVSVSPSAKGAVSAHL